MKINCPNCNSLQAFRPQKREAEDDRLEVFICCRACLYEQVIQSGPRVIVELELDLQTLRGKQLAGVPLGSVIARRERRLEELKRQHGLSE